MLFRLDFLKHLWVQNSQAVKQHLDYEATGILNDPPCSSQRSIRFKRWSNLLLSHSRLIYHHHRSGRSQGLVWMCWQDAGFPAASWHLGRSMERWMLTFRCCLLAEWSAFCLTHHTYPPRRSGTRQTDSFLNYLQEYSRDISRVKTQYYQKNVIKWPEKSYFYGSKADGVIELLRLDFIIVSLFLYYFVLVVGWLCSCNNTDFIVVQLFSHNVMTLFLYFEVIPVIFWLNCQMTSLMILWLHSGNIMNFFLYNFFLATLWFTCCIFIIIFYPGCHTPSYASNISFKMLYLILCGSFLKW